MTTRFIGSVHAPLLYSTELARAVEVADAEGLRVKIPDASADGFTEKPFEPHQDHVRLKEDGASDRVVQCRPISSDLIYGLVNLRTDGLHVLGATKRESGTDLDVKIFRAGVAA